MYLRTKSGGMQHTSKSQQVSVILVYVTFDVADASVA